MAEEAVRLSLRRSLTTCASCETQLAPTLLLCPSCGVLLHAAELTSLASAAEEAEARGDLVGALRTWRDALALLPRAVSQHDAVVARIEDLTRRVDAAPIATRRRHASASAPRGASRSIVGAAGAVLLLVLTKAKLLILGLAKAGTLLSMFAFLAVYIQAYGWWLAVGVVLSIYVHEMGHVAAMVRYGMHASAPMFLPGFGAFVRSSHVAATPREDAVIGLAGPIWGLGAALAAFVVFRTTGGGLWGAIAHVGAVLNLLNLMPVWQLDGARAFRAMSRRQRWGVVALCAIGALVSGERKVWALVLVGAYSAYSSGDAKKGDTRTVIVYLAVAAALTCVTLAAAVPGTPL